MYKHISFSLRRMRRYWISSILAITTCAFSFYMLLTVQVELSQLQYSALLNNELNGQRGYIIEALAINKVDGTIRLGVMPEEIVDRVLSRGNNVIIQLGKHYSISSNFRTSSISATIVFWDDKNSNPRKKKNVFPNCSLVNSTPELKTAIYLVFSKTNWRCLVRPLPSSMKIIETNRDDITVVLPISSVYETVGIDWKSNVSTAWLGDNKFNSIKDLSEWIGNTIRTRYRLSLFNDRFSSDALIVSSGIWSWTIASLILMCLSLIFYIQSTMPAMRSELGLRLCVGVSGKYIIRWLWIDLSTQTLILVTGAYSGAVVMSNFLKLEISSSTEIAIFLSFIFFLFLPIIFTFILWLIVKRKISSPIIFLRRK